MKETVRLVYKTDNNEIELFDFTNEHIDYAAIYNTDKLLGHRLISLAERDNGKIIINLKKKVAGQVVIVYNNGAQVSIKELYTIQKMTDNIKNVEYDYVHFTCGDMEITDGIVELMGIQDKSLADSINKTNITYPIYETTIEPIKIGAYFIDYETAHYKLDTSSIGILNSETKAFIKRELHNQEDSITLRIRGIQPWNQ